MSYEQMYAQKFCTLDKLYADIKDGDYIYCLNSSGEPRTFLAHLHELKGKVKNLRFQMGLTSLKAEVFNEEYAEIGTFVSSFFPRHFTALQLQGRASYIPLHLRNTGKDAIFHLKKVNQQLNYVVLAVSPMDKHGYFTSGSTAMAMRMFKEYGFKVAVEVNEACPRTFGDTYLHISEVDYIYNSDDNKINYLPKIPSSETDLAIGRAIAEMVHDGDNVQLGIGGIPSACAAALRDKKDLGIHTEMFNDGLVDLCKCGAVTNRKKNYFPNKIVTAFSAGSKDVYDYIDNNVNVLHLAVAFVNSPATFARNDRVISVNTSLGVDLMGQCASEALQTKQISGTGGQTETAIGAKESKGGMSIIALHSTREIKQKDGSKKVISNILPVQPEGTVISLSRNDVDFVVTEYGMAALRGATLRERANSLIKIAHPDYRAELEEQAKRLWLI